jgi:hypothetical protein
MPGESPCLQPPLQPFSYQEQNKSCIPIRDPSIPIRQFERLICELQPGIDWHPCIPPGHHVAGHIHVPSIYAFVGVPARKKLGTRGFNRRCLSVPHAPTRRWGLGPRHGIPCNAMQCEVCRQVTAVHPLAAS